MRNRYLNKLFLLCTILLLATACNGIGTADFQEAIGSGGSSDFSSLNFAGIDSVDQIGFTAARLNWTSHADAVAYEVYAISSGTSYIATVVAPASSYSLSGLTQGTSYTYRVKAKDSSGLLDSNTNDVTFSTTSTAAGWNLFWLSNLNNSFSQDGGSASTGDVVIDSSSGTSFSTAQTHEGSHSLFCDSRVTATNRLRLLATNSIINDFDGFKVEFWVQKTANDTFPSLLEVGTNAGNVGVGQNMALLRWPHATNGGILREDSLGATDVVSSAPWFAGNGVWQKIEFAWMKTDEQGQFWVDGVQVQSAPMESTWLDAGTNQLAISFCQRAYNAAGDNGIQAYIDQIAIYFYVE